MFLVLTTVNLFLLPPLFPSHYLNGYLFWEKVLDFSEGEVLEDAQMPPSS